MTGSVVPVSGRRRKAPAQVGNVVPLHARKETSEEIVRAVRGRSMAQELEISRRLRETLTLLEERHRERAQECIPIGMTMDRPMLDDWIEIGQRMLGQQGRHR